MKEIGKDGMDRTASPGEFPPGRSKHFQIFQYLIGNERNEKNSIQFFSKNEILSTFSTIDSRSVSLSNRYPTPILLRSRFISMKLVFIIKKR
jgi:hypothetical protein